MKRTTEMRALSKSNSIIQNQRPNRHQITRPSAFFSSIVAVYLYSIRLDRHQNANSDEPEPKRRPGRPRGSKNRKNRNSQPASAPSKPPFQYANHTALTTTAAGTVPPHHPDVNTHNQQYYEFQWRVLNLCAEFYGAAEELVASPPVFHLFTRLNRSTEKNTATSNSSMLSDGTECQGRSTSYDCRS